MAPEARGYSYVEILVAVALIAVALPPALDALGMQVRGAGVGITEMQREYLLSSRLQEMAGRPFAELDFAADAAGSKSTPTGYSDPPGTEDRLLVYLWHYDFDNVDADGNPFTNPNVNLMWVRVEIENSAKALETILTWY